LNEATLNKEQYTYKAIGYIFKNLTQKNAPPSFSHGKRRRGKILKKKINKGIANTNLPKKKPPILSSKEAGWATDCKLR
jgi:hypothetical protein